MKINKQWAFVIWYITFIVCALMFCTVHTVNKSLDKRQKIDFEAKENRLQFTLRKMELESEAMMAATEIEFKEKEAKKG